MEYYNKGHIFFDKKLSEQQEREICSIFNVWLIEEEERFCFAPWSREGEEGSLTCLEFEYGSGGNFGELLEDMAAYCKYNNIGITPESIVAYTGDCDGGYRFVNGNVKCLNRDELVVLQSCPEFLLQVLLARIRANTTKTTILDSECARQFFWAYMEKHYIASKLWREEDISSKLKSAGYASSKENTAAVINTGLLKNLGECTDSDWNQINGAIFAAAQNTPLVIIENDTYLVRREPPHTSFIATFFNYLDEKVRIIFKESEPWGALEPLECDGDNWVGVLNNEIGEMYLKAFLDGKYEVVPADEEGAE